MPTNLPPEVRALEIEFLNAETIDEKIKILEKIIAKTPKHKGTETYLAEQKRRLKKLREEREKLRKAKKLRSKPIIPKDCKTRIAIIGQSLSGKTSFLEKISENLGFVEDFVVTSVDVNGIKFQFVECPGFNNSDVMQMLSSSDIILCFIDLTQDLDKQIFFFKNFESVLRVKKTIYVATKGDLPGTRESFDELIKKLGPNVVPITITKEETIKKLLDKVYDESGWIKVYTKEPGKEPSKKPLIVKKESTIRDVAEKIHKDFIEKFKYCKVWGKSAKFPGQMVGLNHKLSDGDIVEFHLK